MNILFSLSLWTPVLAWAGVIFGLSAVPHLNSGLGVWDYVLRKIAHVVEYAVLTGLLLRAYRRQWPQTLWSKHARIVAFIAIAYAASDEFHQSFVPGRGPSVHDVLIDSVGVAIMLMLYRQFKIYE